MQSSDFSRFHIYEYCVLPGLTACINRGRMFPRAFRHWIFKSKEAAMKKTSRWCCLVVLLSLGSAERMVAQATRSS